MCGAGGGRLAIPGRFLRAPRPQDDAVRAGRGITDGGVDAWPSVGSLVQAQFMEGVGMAPFVPHFPLLSGPADPLDSVLVQGAWDAAQWALALRRDYPEGRAAEREAA